MVPGPECARDEVGTTGGRRRDRGPCGRDTGGGREDHTNPLGEEHPCPHRTSADRVGIAAASSSSLPASPPPRPTATTTPTARLVGRAVLPVETYAPGPPSGAGLVPAGRPDGDQRHPLPDAVAAGRRVLRLVEGRRPGEYLAMPDNGFGGKANSGDFLIRAYYITPDFKTARGGIRRGRRRRLHPVRRPRHVIGFPIVREGTPERWLTGGDIDPESVQRGRHGDLWVGDEFGPWILHFDASGRLLEAPIALPDGLMSPNNPHLAPADATVLNSRGIEAMAMTPNGRSLFVVMEGAVVGDDPRRPRRVYRYDIRARQVHPAGRLPHRRAADPVHRRRPGARRPPAGGDRARRRRRLAAAPARCTPSTCAPSPPTAR